MERRRNVLRSIVQELLVGSEAVTDDDDRPDFTSYINFVR